MVTPDNPKNKHKQRVIPKEFLLKRLQTGYSEINVCCERSNHRQINQIRTLIVTLKTEVAKILSRVSARGITTKDEQEIICSAVQKEVTKAKDAITILHSRVSDKESSGIHNIIRRKISEVLSKIRTEITEKFEVKESDSNGATPVADIPTKTDLHSTGCNCKICKIYNDHLDKIEELQGTPDEGEKTDIIDTRDLINKSELLSQHYELVVFRYFKQVLEKIFKQIKLKIVSEKKRFYPKFIPVSIQEFNVLFYFADTIKNNLKEILPEQISSNFSEVDGKLIVNDPLTVVSGIDEVVFKAAESLCNNLENMDIEMQPLFVKRILEGCVLDLDDVICAVNNNVMPEEQDSAFDTTDIILNGLLYSQIPAENQKDTLQWLEVREMDETEKEIIKEKLIVLKITNGLICPEKIIEITDYINDQMYCGLPIRNPEQIQKYIAVMSKSVDEKAATDIEIRAIADKPDTEAETLLLHPETLLIENTADQPGPEVPALRARDVLFPKVESVPAPEELSEPEADSVIATTEASVPKAIEVPALEPAQPAQTLDTVSTVQNKSDKLTDYIQIQKDLIIAWIESLPNPINKKLYWKMALFFYSQIKNNADKLPKQVLCAYIYKLNLLKKYYTKSKNSFSVDDKDIPKLIEIAYFESDQSKEIKTTAEIIPETNNLQEEFQLFLKIREKLEQADDAAQRFAEMQGILDQIDLSLKTISESNKNLEENNASLNLQITEKVQIINLLRAEIHSLTSMEDFIESELLEKISQLRKLNSEKAQIEHSLQQNAEVLNANNIKTEQLTLQLRDIQAELSGISGYMKKRNEIIAALKGVFDLLSK
jgi:hypothetical protein